MTNPKDFKIKNKTVLKTLINKKIQIKKNKNIT